MDFIPDFDFSKVFSNFDIVDWAALLVIEFIIIAAVWQFVRKRKTPSRPSFAKTVVTVVLVEVALSVVLLVLFVVAFGISLSFALH